MILSALLLKPKIDLLVLRCAFSQGMARHVTSTKNNFEIPSPFVNRNPRNLEQMLLARKPSGWEWDRPSRTFWYRLELQISSRNIFARVVHNSGSCVAEASTTEWGIKKQLISTADTNAASAIGRVLARRCFEAGLVAVHVDLSDELRSSRKAQTLLNGLSEEGLQLKEPADLDEHGEKPLVTMFR